MKFWPERNVGKPLLQVHSWTVVWDPLGLTVASEQEVSDISLETNAKDQGEDIIQLRLGDPDEFPIIDLGYYGSPKRFVVRFQVDDDWEDVSAATYYDSVREALRAVQDTIIATEGWSYWNTDDKESFKIQ